MKNGFTLIELLAVIVILAIIAVIAVPIVINIIDDSKKNSTLRTAEFYLDAVEMSVANSTLKNKNIPDGTYNIKDGNICLNDDCTEILKVEVNGEKPTTGTIVIDKGQIYETLLEISNQQIGKYGDSSVGLAQYKPGQPIYFNVETGKICDKSEYKEDNSKTGYNGFKNKDSEGNLTDRTANQNGCMKFYVTKDLGGAINLILDHNTTALVEWVSKSDYSDDEGYGTYGNTDKGPITLVKHLKQDTDAWNGIIKPLSYFNKIYTVEYNKARIITAQEIAEITGNKNWKESKNESTWYWFDSLTQTPKETCTDGNTTECQYGWLYDRMGFCVEFGCENSDSSTDGYWTISSGSEIYYAWRIALDSIYQTSVNANHAFGVRPVITIPKK